jgi:DNA-binding LacI/PurR family transcriptional regulator
MKAKTTLYQEIYDFIKTEIGNGRLRAGERVPSEAELSLQFGVSRITSKKALEMLAEEKVLFRIPGKGSFVGTRPLNEQAVPGLPAMKTIGIIMSDFSPTYGTVLLKSLIIRCGQLGFLPLVICTEGNQELEDQSVERLYKSGVSGLLVMPIHGEHYSHTMLKLVVEGFPLVAIDRFLHGLPAPYVGSDNFQAVRNAVRHLAQLGHQRIGIISPIPKKTSTIEDRILGYESGIHEMQLTRDANLMLTDLVSMLPGRRSAATLAADQQKIEAYLQANPGMSALISVEYGIAAMVCTMARALGRQVPGDLSILAFDGPEGMDSLTGIGQLQQQEEALGARAVELLDRLIKGENNTDKVFLPVDLHPPTSLPR